MVVRLVPLPAEEAPPGEQAATSLSSDDEYLVDFWRTSQGLPNNTVNALLQTRDGYLWVGTASGLARFDGFDFTVIGEETAPGLKEARITALLEDHEGALWVGTQGTGVIRIRNGRIQQFDRNAGLTDDAVTSLAEDSEGRMWIGTQGGLNPWDDGRLTTFNSDTLKEREAIVALHAGRSGVLWITTRFEVYREQNGQAVAFQFEDMPQARNADFVGVYEDRAGNLWTYGATFLLNLSQGKRFNYFRSPDHASSRVWTICEQGEGGFWIGTSGRGLFRFHNGRFDAAGAHDGLDQCDVRALHADAEGNLWIGTRSSGLARLRTRQWRLLSREAGLNSNRLTTMAVNGAGELYVGTADAGLLKLDGQQLKPLLAGPPFDYATDIRSLCFDDRGALWVGTWGMGLFELEEGGRQTRFTTADGLSDEVVPALVPDRDGDAVWAGTLSGGLHRVSRTNVLSWSAADGLTGRAIYCLLQTADGDLLIGSEGGGLVRRTGNRFSEVAAPSAGQNRAVLCLAEDRARRLWMGTEGAGAFCLVRGKWVPVGPEQGLAAEVVPQIVQGPNGNYWFGSEKGIFQVREQEMLELVMGIRPTVKPLLCRRAEGGDGLRELRGWPSAVVTPNHDLWFATASGLLDVDPERVLPVAPPRVMIEKVLVDGKTVLAPTLGQDSPELRLGPGIRRLDFEFTAVSFNAPQKTRFRHMLEGYDSDWVQSDTARREHYGPVPPGRYRFRVIASNAEGIWNESGAALSLTVVPPIWRSGWFIALSACALVGGIWAVVRHVSLRRLRAQLHWSEQRRAMERERARIAQDMHDEIGSKLTRISFLSEAARNAGAEATGVSSQVNAIADTSRELLQALDEIVWAVNPRNDNLEHLAGYLEQYAREYFHGTPVDCAISVPDRLPRVSLKAELRHNVFLAFEEALSNVLQHASAATIRIGMELKPDAFEIIVRDDGAGFANRPTQGNRPGHDGLQNMRDRLRAVGGVCAVASERGQGTNVRLWFPLNGVAATPDPRAASL